MTDTPTEYQPFYWRSYTIFHGEGVLKIGTDAILLGNWIGKVIDNPIHIIDAGCGTGILSIMAAFHFPDATITAIDNHPEAIELAKLNAIHNGLEKRMDVALQDVLEDPGGERLGQLIISNPPFFYNQLPAARVDNQKSKHSDASAAQWIVAIEKRLTKNGRVALVIPFPLAGKWIEAANQQRMYCERRLNIFSFEKDTHPVRSLIILSRVLKKPAFDKLVLYNADQHHTDQYTQWLK